MSQTRKARSGSVAKSVFCRCRTAGAAGAAGPAGPARGQDSGEVVWVRCGRHGQRQTHGDKPLTNLLVGLTAIETAGRAHHRVIASLAEDKPVLPVRLATVYPDDATIRRQLAERRADVTGPWPPYSFAEGQEL